MRNIKFWAELSKCIVKMLDSKEYKEEYSTLLIINCAFSVISYVNQTGYKYVPPTLIKDSEDWGIEQGQVSFPVGDQVKLKDVIRHIRNSVNHNLAEIIYDNTGQISYLKFIDCDKKHIKTFEAKIPVNNLKKFSFQLLDTVIKGMEAKMP